MESLQTEVHRLREHLEGTLRTARPSHRVRAPLSPLKDIRDHTAPHTSTPHPWQRDFRYVSSETLYLATVIQVTNEGQYSDYCTLKHISYQCSFLWKQWSIPSCLLPCQVPKAKLSPCDCDTVWVAYKTSLRLVGPFFSFLSSSFSFDTFVILKILAAHQGPE